MIVGFSPRKQAIALYLAGGFKPLKAELSKLGKYETGKGCLYMKSLSDVHAEEFGTTTMLGNRPTTDSGAKSATGSKPSENRKP